MESPIIKLLDHEDLRERGIKYSRPHIWRLYKAGKFPKPVKLSASRNAWLASDIDVWLAARIDA
jgi:prophage regulatory protein